MPINYQQIRAAIQNFAHLAPTQAKLREKQLALALFQLESCVSDPEEFQQKIQSALTINPDLRCALPANEIINSAYDHEKTFAKVVLLAADGSQIIPNQHLAVQFGVINIGSIRMQSGAVPKTTIESELLYADEILTDQGYLVGEEIIALRRDYKERSYLLKAALEEDHQVITLTDGPLELFHQGRETPEYQQLLQDYIDTLSALAEQKILTAGYVDKPRGDLVIRLLELSTLTEEQLTDAGKIRPLKALTDADLFGELLLPSQRSAVFQLHSTSANRFQGELSIHFFYINIGKAGKPQIARVEFPAWLLEESVNIDLLQDHLLDQCAIMGGKAYPYILHRAHEIATVSYAEREQILGLLQQSLYSQGIEPGQKSSKQFHKDLPGKTRKA